uniref:Retrovirus-related Pol polyprotein from transposon 17.6 n=1 Tax=Cajanus cajan TaxID=3821 RepID=A0A151T8Q1_CAJCA|nr:Retrovirus-related Pol polyprotein from transposon 17.6 [Cajanus cajan]
MCIDYQKLNNLEDQEKTSFTCPFGVFAYRKMPFELCNAPGHAGFYKRFIKDFSMISRPLSNLLNKDTPFYFNDSCLKAFEALKARLTSAPIIIAPDWKLDFEIMCDVSDYAVRAVLDQRRAKTFHVIHYASKVLNEAKINYATTEKDLLAIVFALEKSLGHHEMTFLPIEDKVGLQASSKHHFKIG